MITRRQFIIGSLGTALTPLSFYEKAFSHYENFGEALIKTLRESLMYLLSMT
jgi:hypothetical protein